MILRGFKLVFRFGYGFVPKLPFAWQLKFFFICPLVFLYLPAYAGIEGLEW